MKIIPAIDLIDGKAVRLQKGDYSKVTVYSDSPEKVAKYFYGCGARYLHRFNTSLHVHFHFLWF